MTPREFQAFAAVKRAHDKRLEDVEEHRTRLWAISLVDFRNIHFRGGGRSQWTVDEILNRKRPETPAGIPIADPEEFRIKMIMSGLMRDDQVPEWAKATVAASKALESKS